MMRIGEEIGRLQQICLDAKNVFPIPTRKKPDIVIWCEDRKIVHLVELTVPHEDNIDDAQVRKDERYEHLLENCEDAGWSAVHFPVEVGCRGFIGLLSLVLAFLKHHNS